MRKQTRGVIGSEFNFYQIGGAIPRSACPVQASPVVRQRQRLFAAKSFYRLLWFCRPVASNPPVPPAAPAAAFSARGSGVRGLSA